MAMTYTSLIAAKGSPGSIANWVDYAKLDLETIVDEAQSLLFQMLRVREMRTEWTFGVAAGQANQPLPDRFLDPIGQIFDVTNSTKYGHNIETDIAGTRAYDNSISGAYGNNPYAIVTGSSLITITKAAHGLTQDSTVTDSFSPPNTWPITRIVDANNFVVESGTVQVATASVGGSGLTYTANKLIAGSPSRWSVWDEQVKFDVAFEAAATLKLLYFRAPLPLSATNQSNWLTNRYPILMRKACQTQAADFMKDDDEYQKGVNTLSALIQSTAAENDLLYRGAEFGTDTP